MSDKKISELTALTGANVADTDLLPIVDTSATETKKITFGEFKSALDTATGFVRITGDTMTGNLSFGDNNKAIFGAGSDLQIYHNANNSYIQDVGTGKLHITSDGTGVSIDKGTSELMATFDIDGAVTLYHDNAAKLATTATGIDVTGTVTADGLTVDGGTYHKVVSTFPSTYVTNLQIGQQGNINNDASIDELLFNHTGTNAASNTLFKINSKNVLNIDTSGDISFYEPTGTTPKFFWDASAEELQLGDNLLALTPVTTGTTGSRISANGGGMLRLASGGSDKMYVLDSGNVGIGIGSPSSPLHVHSTTSGLPVTSGTTQTNGVFRLTSSATSGTIDFGMNGSNPWIQVTDYTGLNNNYNLLLNPNGGNVGIGTSSPTQQLDVTATGATNPIIVAQNTTASNGGAQIRAGNPQNTLIMGTDSNGGGLTGTANASYFYTTSTSPIVFLPNATERMRIDSSGSWMTGNTVARTASQYSNQGGASWYHPDQHFEISTTSNQAALEVGKNNANDGELIAFRKQGTTVGSIGTYSSRMYIGTGDVGLQFLDAADNILPINPSTPANRDGAIDLGAGAVRFKDLYLSGGVYLGGAVAANYLDDYEQGTWVPQIEALDGTNATMDASSHGEYIKVGNAVTVTARVVTTSAASIGGSRVYIDGLPFNASSGGAGYTATMAGYGTNLNIASGQSIGVITEPSEGRLRLRLWDATGGTTDLEPSEWSDDGHIWFSLTYTI